MRGLRRVKKIVVDAPRGMCVRNFLQQGIVGDLARHYDVTVLSEFADDLAFQQAFNDVRHVRARPGLVRAGIVRRASRRVVEQLYHGFRFREVTRTAHLRSFAMMLELQLRHEFIRYLAGECIYRVLLVQRMRDLVERVLSHTSVPRALPLVDGTDLVFLTHAYYEGSHGLTAFARAHGIKTVGFVHSWDNLNTKGVLLHKFDRLFVWNDYMKALVLKCYPEYRDEEIIVTGSPTFDSYHDARAVLPFEEFRAEVDFDSTRQKLVTFVLGSPNIYPRQDVVLDRFAARVAASELGPIRLVVRFEPNFISRPFYAEYRASVEAITARYDFIHVSYPTNVDSSAASLGRWESGHDRAGLFLPSALKYSDVVVNTASTTSVQAAIFDTPVVSMFFNHDESDRGFFESHEIMAFYQDHYHDLVWRSGGTALATSSDDLVGKVRSYLAVPALDRDGRRRIVAAVCGSINQGSRAKIVAAIRECVEDERPRRVSESFPRVVVPQGGRSRPVAFKQRGRI